MPGLGGAAGGASAGATIGMAGGPIGAGIGAAVGALAGFLADHFGGPDEAWAPSEETLDNMFGSYYQDIMQREQGIPDLAEGLWGSLGSHIPTDGSLSPMIEAIMMGGPRRDRFSLLNLGQQASASRAGIQSQYPMPSEGIGNLTSSLMENFWPTETPEISNTQGLYEYWMNNTYRA